MAGLLTQGLPEFQSTLSVRRATERLMLNDFIRVISIHALREESDTSQLTFDFVRVTISIHALREESDRSVCRRTSQANPYFNPRSP